ncbi:NVEALA domain-containing protein [Bacteroides sp.]|uniref:NVEALA domain-containing protein n=2 Tax=Bacteroides TaxID=816 RepID=UPI0023BDF5A6|nr:NVEALA domain-containing protein [Bacteroides sp.]MDE5711237.1 NVEALA domain-containing protein [Bacteroides sp.]MDE5759781.1 NVEALA domain-containing protein [Bacteroides sp.]MDE6215037.1 NVEALA domain-containing protein [Bacteroides sp.]
MKKKITILVVINFIVAISSISLNSKSKLPQITDLNLSDIEALAQSESGGDNWWVQPETRRCKLELGGGWFESSVERVCVFCATPNSCTAKSCGEVF